MLKFLVKNQKIEVLERDVIASDQIAFVNLRFIFDGDWKKFHKVVQFTQCDETYNLVLGTDGTACLLPSELHAGAVKISVFGFDAENTEGLRATTVPVTLNIRASGFVGDNPPIPPTPDLYTQLLQKITDAQKGDDGKSAYELAVQEGYSGTLNEWLDSLKGEPGHDGTNGTDGTNGVNGLSAFEIAQKEGFSGSEAEWLESLKGEPGADGKKGNNGLSAYELAKKEGYSGSLTEWLESLKGANGKTPDMSQYPKTTEVESLIQQQLSPVSDKAHTHGNKAVLDKLTDSMISDIQGMQQFEQSVRQEIQSMNDVVQPVATQAHWHYNLNVLNGITADKVAKWDSNADVSELQKQFTQFSETVNQTLESLQTQIDNLGGTAVTIFKSGNDALVNYGDSIYIFYNEGYRSLSGFAGTYPNFCSAENDYALSYNQMDFNWAAEIYTISTIPVSLSPNKSIMLSYQSGATDSGELYLVRKPEDEKSVSDLAQYVYEQIQSGGAVTVNFNWLYADSYITTLHDCEGVTAGEYLIAWKGVSDNTHPTIRTIKIMEG